MYCKKCKNLLPEREFICNHCKFDNFFESGYQETLIVKKKIKQKKQSPVFSVVVLFMLVCIGVILLYSVNETKAYDGYDITTTQTIKIELAKHEFVLNDLKFIYPETFGTSTNTIFYKKNTDININIREITLEEYNTMINSNDILDAFIKTIPTKTFAGDNYYSHLLIYNSKYYDIKVNYVSDPYSFTEDLQKSISDIINSIEIINEL